MNTVGPVRDTVSTVGPPHALAERLYAEADAILNEPELAELLRDAAAFLEFDQLEIIGLRKLLAEETGVKDAQWPEVGESPAEINSEK